MSKQIFFSVVITVFNKERDIKNTIHSVIAQLYNMFEIIIVDDGSTDNSKNIINQIQDARIKYFNIPHTGVSYARNFGVDKACFDYIVFLDGDDLWLPDHLNELHHLIDKYVQGNWFATAYEILLDKSKTRIMNAGLVHNNPGSHSGMYNYFKYSMSDSLALTSAVCMKKDFFYDLGGFNVNFDSGQDIDLWIKAGLKSDLCFSHKITVTYNTLGDNRITDKNNKNKRFCDYGDYGCEDNNMDLKRFLNFYRYWHIIKFKISGNYKSIGVYKKRLDKSVLTKNQRILIAMPSFILKFLFIVKSRLEKAGVFFRISN